MFICWAGCELARSAGLSGSTPGASPGVAVRYA